MPGPKRRLRRASAAALALAVVSLLGLGTASAAALHIGTSGRDVGAGAAAVAACDTSVTTALSDYQFQTGPQTWVARSVTVDGIADACAGHAMTVTTRTASGAVIATGSATVGAPGATRTTVQLGSMTPTAVARIDAVIA